MPETAADQQPGTGDDATTGTLPADERAPGPRLSLPQRAPIEPFTKQELTVRLSRDLRGAEFSEVIRQENQCIRSRVKVVSHSLTRGEDANVNVITTPAEPAPAGSSAAFPYPADYREVIQRRSDNPSVDEEGTVGRDNTNTNNADGGNDTTWRVFEIARHLGISPAKLFKVLRQPEPPRRRRNVKADRSMLGYHLQVVRQQEWSYQRKDTSNVNISVSKAVGKIVQVTVRPVYVVVGIFPRGHSHHPLETAVFVPRPERLFWRLRWAVFRLRGWQGTFLSLRHVKAVRLYQCDRSSGNHRRVELDDNGLADLQLFLDTYNRHWYGVPSEITLAWAAWIHQALNNNSHNVEDGTYALELVLDWSVARITFVVLLPVLLSLAVGVWLNARDWTDLATIQTAWGTASYVVTAGGCEFFYEGPL
ncbi:hypothetical protein C8A01DRAFT_33269 [Parachaetomium inaequale]|uniref:Uncharacterized protein n=1 Tax=Parachaetomium inaequale TaxID=2588326 RepID=A0AAN6SUJ9_9PEZI|nr:hypothetical protein C8A01DRAFT_33269 [Parachaetomium inaequale]